MYNMQVNDSESYTYKSISSLIAAISEMMLSAKYNNKNISFSISSEDNDSYGWEARVKTRQRAYTVYGPTIESVFRRIESDDVIYEIDSLTISRF